MGNDLRVRGRSTATIIAIHRHLSHFTPITRRQRESRGSPSSLLATPRKSRPESDARSHERPEIGRGGNLILSGRRRPDDLKNATCGSPRDRCAWSDTWSCRLRQFSAHLIPSLDPVHPPGVPSSSPSHARVLDPGADPREMLRGEKREQDEVQVSLDDKARNLRRRDPGWTEPVAPRVSPFPFIFFFFHTQPAVPGALHAARSPACRVTRARAGGGGR